LPTLLSYNKEKTSLNYCSIGWRINDAFHSSSTEMLPGALLTENLVCPSSERRINNQHDFMGTSPFSSRKAL
jgi:hypothetical protein